MARPKQADHRTKIVTLRFAPWELRAVDKRARADRVSRSDYIRRLVMLDAAQERIGAR